MLSRCLGPRGRHQELGPAQREQVCRHLAKKNPCVCLLALTLSVQFNIRVFLLTLEQKSAALKNETCGKGGLKPVIQFLMVWEDSPMPFCHPGHQMRNFPLEMGPNVRSGCVSLYRVRPGRVGEPCMERVVTLWFGLFQDGTQKPSSQRQTASRVIWKSQRH